MRRLVFPVLIAALTLACSLLPTAAPGSDETGDLPEVYSGLGLEALHGYETSFEMRFDGTYTWRYRLETRSDGQVMEYGLHLEGLSESLNPGDIRAVVDPDRISMRGPGTGDECFFFPADLDPDQAFLSPDDLIDPTDFAEPLVLIGSESISGRDATHFAYVQSRLGDWQDVEVDIWLDAITGAVLRYDLSGQGHDPLFDAGDGTLSGQFVVEDVGSQVIEPIAGCEIDLPLPLGATRLTKLPGLLAFEAESSSDEIVAFYEAELPDDGWEALAEPQFGEDATLLSYGRGNETLNINVEIDGDDVLVELWISAD